MLDDKEIIEVGDIDMPEMEQPAWMPAHMMKGGSLEKHGRERKPVRFMRGARASIARLEELGFDPIRELVNTYDRILGELAYQEQMREGIVVEIRGDGKPRAYRAEVHHALYDRMIKVATELTRYGYGRVPEGIIIEPGSVPSLIIELSDGEDKITINAEKNNDVTTQYSED